MNTFCRLNGWLLAATQVEKFQIMMALAAGEITQEQLADWIGRHLIALDPTP